MAIQIGPMPDVAPQKGEGTSALGGRDTWPLKLAYGLIAVALIKPDSLSYIGLEWLDLGLMGVDIVLLLLLIGAFLAGKLTLSWITIAVTLHFLAVIPATLLGSGDFGLLVRMAGPAVAACMLTDFALPRHPGVFLSGMTFGLLGVYAANFISIILFYPEGMYRTSRVAGDLYLMGFDNAMIYGLLPLVVYAILRSFLKSGRAMGPVSVAAAALLFSSVFYVSAVSGIIGAVCFFLIMGFLAVAKLSSTARLAVCATWLFVAIAIVVRRHDQVVPSFITQSFDKDETLTGRTDLWDYALEQASKHPFLGVGIGEWVPGSRGHYYPHPHSLLVDCLYTGGLLGAVALAAVVIAIFWFSVRGSGSLVQAVVISGALSLLIVEIANSTQFKALFWGTFALLAHTDRLTGLVPSISPRGLTPTGHGLGHFLDEGRRPAGRRAGLG